jgi:flagellar hook-length control protein FliK
MMTQSVITQTANLFGSATGSVTSKGKKAGSGFDLLIDSSLKSGQNVKGNAETSTTKKTSVQKNDTNDNQKSDVADGNADQSKVNSNNDPAKTEDTKATKETNTQTVKTEDTEGTKETGSSKDEVTEDQQVMAQLATMLQSVREAVMESLNLSSEELDQLLSNQGMSITDLLQSENLQQLVLVNNGETDILAALTDEGLAEKMKQLLQTVNGIQADTNLQITQEQLKALLTQLQTQGQETIQDEGTGEVIHPEEQANFTQEHAKTQETVNASNGSKDNDEVSTSATDNQNSTGEVTKLTEAQETNSGTQADANSKENKDLKAEDQFQVFVDNLVKSSPATEVDMSGNLVRVTELRDIANQIIERIKVSIQPDQTSMELQLNPENLGKVNLSVQSKNGVMTAQFVVQNETSKEAIESQLHTLRETLNQQGIKVEAIEVTVSTYAFEQNQESSNNQSEAQKEHSGRQISLEEAFNMSEVSEEENLAEDITGIRGSQIDYTA